MSSLKWLRSLTDNLTPPKRQAPSPEALNGTDTGESPEIDLGAKAVLDNAVYNARHALVMSYRAKHHTDPSQAELTSWLEPIWHDREQVRAIIQRHNAMALSLGERFPTFWTALADAALK